MTLQEPVHSHILVTGGAGFIGSHMVQRLLLDGHKVIVLDNLVKGHEAAVHPDAIFVQGDCGDRDLLRDLFGKHKVKAVMHFAAFIEAGESMREPERFYANNTAETLRLLEAMIEAGVDRFIFSSTAATYGAPRYVPIDEAHPQEPTNAYGHAKLLVEMALNWMHDLRGLRVAIFRYFNAAGSSDALGEDHAPETHLIPLILDVAAGKRENIKIFGTDYATPDGTCIRDYIHIEDLAAAHVLALDALEHETKLVFNLGNQRGYSVREVIEVARRVTGHAIPVVEGGRRPGDPAELVATSEKIQSQLGWAPKYPGLEEIIASAWRWRQRHPDGYPHPSGGA